MTNKPERSATILAPADAAVMPQPPDNLATPILAREGVEVEYYAPRAKDAQTPHARDEVYFVARGGGEFVTASGRKQIAAGDYIFVPAWAEHRFERFSADFATWVVFFGPEKPEP